MASTPIRARRQYLVSPSWDFWLLGGFSLAIGAIFLFAGLMRESSFVVGGYMARLPATFGILSLICNYPHFLISYRFGYGRGAGFVRRFWFQLLAVPVLLVALFTVAFYCSGFAAPENALTTRLNLGLAWLGSDFYFGAKTNLGRELMAVGVWLMYLTVGWHYSKQVFGCLAAYSGYRNYPLTGSQRTLLKYHLLGVAVVNFLIINTYNKEGYESSGASLAPMATILFGFPPVIVQVAGSLLLVSLLWLLYTVVWANYRKTGALPGATMTAVFCSFYLWWIPVFTLPEYYAWAVPFFHSLQYLPFAYRMEVANKQARKVKIVGDVARILLLLLAGFLAFEYLPELLDTRLETTGLGLSSFFAVAAAVFLNVHHFFIDNVAWRSRDAEVRAAIGTG